MLALSLFVFWRVFGNAASAQPAPSQCAEYGIIKNAINRHEQRVTYRGLNNDGSLMMEIFVDNREGNNKQFTVIIRRSDSTITCVVFSGFGLSDVRGDTPWKTPHGEDS